VNVDLTTFTEKNKNLSFLVKSKHFSFLTYNMNRFRLKRRIHKMKKYDVVIIGGGPAGLFSAIQCASCGLSVALLEKNISFGKKLLISGSGKCNLTQVGEIEAFIHHYGTSSNFVKPCLYAFSNDSFRKFLHKNNLSTVCVENGKGFPQSMKAIDV